MYHDGCDHPGQSMQTGHASTSASDMQASEDDWEADPWDLLEDRPPSSGASSNTISIHEPDDDWIVCETTPTRQRAREPEGNASNEEASNTGQICNLYRKDALIAGAQDKVRKSDLKSDVKSAPSVKRYTRAHDASCQLCTETIRGDRWICKDCPAWSLCQMCILLALSDYDVHPGHTLVRVMQPHDIIRLASTQIARDSEFYTPAFEPLLHPDETCSTCKSSIIGVRYECGVSECKGRGMVFCQDCEARPINAHPPTHPLIKYKMRKKDSRAVKSYDFPEHLS